MHFWLEHVNLLSYFIAKLVKPHMKIQKASEDYLESMLMMKEQHGYIRSVDVADHLGVTKPSVTYATKQLKQNGFITCAKTDISRWTATASSR